MSRLWLLLAALDCMNPAAPSPCRSGLWLSAAPRPARSAFLSTEGTACCSSAAPIMMEERSSLGLLEADTRSGATRSCPETDLHQAQTD